MLQAATWRTKGLGATLPPKDIKEPTKLVIQTSMGHHGDMMAREISWNIWCIYIYLYIYIYKHQSYVWVGLKMRDLPNGQCQYNFGRKYDRSARKIFWVTYLSGKPRCNNRCLPSEIRAVNGTLRFFFNGKVRAAWILMYYWRVFEWQMSKVWNLAMKLKEGNWYVFKLHNPKHFGFQTR